MAFVLPALATIGSSVGITAASATPSLGTAFSVIGTGVSALGTLSSAQAESANASFNARVNEVNARQKLIDARLARQSAERRAGQIRRDSRRRVATIRSLQAKSGVVTTEGSPLLVQESQLSEGLLEANIEEFTGELDAQGLESQSQVARMRASALRDQASSFRTVGSLSAGAKILKGTGEILS